MSHRCLGCQKDFLPRPNVPEQRYCSSRECQRKRRADWQRRKLLQDADYREHQKKAKSNWREQHRDYMRAYRRNNPAYRERERLRRRESRKQTHIAGVTPRDQCAVKMDACTSEKTFVPIESGYFHVCRVPGGNAVKMDECPYGSIVQLVVVKENRSFTALHGAAP